MPPTKQHKPVIWECMLATLYAAKLLPDGKHEVQYFDYDWDAAFKFAGLTKHGSYDPALDTRLAKTKGSWWYPDGPGRGKLCLWSLPPTEEARS